MKPARILQVAAGIALAGAGLFIFFRKVDFHKLWAELLASNPWAVVLCAALAIGSLLLRALRWNIMLPNGPRWSKKGLFSIIAVGFMLNNILPARIGEVARVVLLWKRNGFGPAVAIGSLVLERAIDLLAFMVCFFLPVFFIGAMHPSRELGGATILNVARAVCGVFCLSIIAFFLYARFPSRFRALGKKAEGLLPRSVQKKASTMANDVLLNLHWTASLRKTILVILYTALIMLCYAGTIIALVNDPRFGLFHGLFSNAFAALGAAIPLTPGFVGTLHAVLLQGLLLCGISREKATAVTILYHGIGYCAVTITGLYFYFKMHVKVKDLSEAGKVLNK